MPDNKVESGNSVFFTGLIVLLQIYSFEK